MDWLLTSPPDEVKLIQEIYESTYNKSLKKALEAKCGKKFFLALSALLVPPEEFLAMRLEKAMKGWSADDKVLIRILGGLDHASKPSMLQVADAYHQAPPPPVPQRPVQMAMPAGTFPVLVPAGHGPGMQLMVRAPNTGQMMTVIIPQGVGPGGQFAVPLPQPPRVQYGAPQQNWRTAMY